MINSVTLVGRLTKDPELKYTPSGVPMARFNLAVNRQFTAQDGEREADFISCICWRKTAENLANYMKKGSLIGLTGRIQTGSYEGQDGKRVFTCDVVADNITFLESRGGEQSNNQANNNHSNYNQNQQNSNQNYGNNTNGYPNQQYNGGGQQHQQPPRQQYNTRIDEDPFANGKNPIEVSEDDLPF